MNVITIKQGHIKILKFLVSGGCAALVEYCIFLFLINATYINILVANVISFLCGLMVSFIFNKIWVFKSKNTIRHEFIRYFILALINLIISTVIINVMVNVLNILPFATKLITMILIATWNYVIFSKFIFKTN